METTTSFSYYRAVIISETVRSEISFSESPDYEILITADITAQLRAIRTQQADKILFLLFVIPLAESAGLQSAIGKTAGSNPKKDKEYVSFLLFGKAGEIAEKVPDGLHVSGFRESEVTAGEFAFLAGKVFETLQGDFLKIQESEEHTIKLMDAWNDQESLIEIGKALSLEKDPDKLLRTILYFSKKITGADAGSIFIVEKHEGIKRLRFKYSHTFSKDLSYEEFTMPLDNNSIAGYVAVTGQVLNIPDVYTLDQNSPIAFNPSFDTSHGYRTKSMLVLPMRNHIDEIIGVIQLINSKESAEFYTGNEAFEVRLSTQDDFKFRIKPFHKRYENLMEAVAGQAAIAMENNRMLLQIEHQFEEFVKASVTAIESRDPATSGHSFRVAGMCVRTALLINDSSAPVFNTTNFSEIQLKELEFAALLHDFGKVYIDPAIFIKAKKLYPRDFEYLMMRLNFLYRSIELTYLEKYSAYNDLPNEMRDKLQKLMLVMEKVAHLNEPFVRTDDVDDEINSMLSFKDELYCTDLQDHLIPLLEDSEVKNLKIKRGSLNDEERKVIESHVVHTYTFVSKIPWPEEYINIPEIAMRHHEKLDGTGYPDRLKGKENIPLQSRIMAIADIFDALNAADRPYKKAVPKDKIFDILREEAASGKLDGDLVELFIAGKAWDLGADEGTDRILHHFINPLVLRTRIDTSEADTAAPV